MSSCTINVHLKPRAKRNSCTIGADNTIEIAVSSPPVDNKANEHLVRFLADCLDLPKSALTIIKGEHARNKAVAIEGLSIDEVMNILHKNTLQARKA